MSHTKEEVFELEGVKESMVIELQIVQSLSPRNLIQWLVTPGNLHLKALLDDQVYGRLSED